MLKATIMKDATSKMMLNDTRNCVSEAIDGYLLTRSDLCRLDDPIAKVVLRSDLPEGKVSLLSGGGAGHEPAHIGLVGAGMLSAAVSGDVFSSPPTDSVLKALRVLQCGKCCGCLLVVKNYTGDKLAFSSAAEIANRNGFPCEVVLVSDDVSMEQSDGITGQRGLAGVVLVHKIAGALADAGESLAVVAEAARKVAAAVCTVGASLSCCNVPGLPRSSRLDGERTEIGLGIHGEAGKILIEKTLSAKEVAEQLVNIISRRCLRGTRVAAIINNLGGLSGVELGVITKDLVKKLQEEGFIIIRLYVAPIVTSFDSKGVSLTLLPIDISLGAANMTLMEALDAHTDVPHWPLSTKGSDGVCMKAMIKTIPFWDSQPLTSESLDTLKINPVSISKAIDKIEKALKDSSSAIDALDALAGDGDAGETMTRVGSASAEGVRNEIARAQGQGLTLSKIFEVAAIAIGQQAGGTSGVLYSLMLNIASSATRSVGTLNFMEESLNGVEAALNAVQRVGGAKSGDRTFLDALFPALIAARTANSNGLSVKEVMTAAAEAARNGACATATMTPRAGRATYVPIDNVLGNKDAGAFAASVWLTALASSIEER